MLLSRRPIVFSSSHAPDTESLDADSDTIVSMRRIARIAVALVALSMLLRHAGVKAKAQQSSASRRLSGL